MAFGSKPLKKMGREKNKNKWQTEQNRKYIFSFDSSFLSQKTERLFSGSK